MNMPRVKKNKEKIYDEFIQEIRLNNLETIKRIFNTADEVANCILENYNYRCLSNEDFFALREINESVFDFSERKNINSDIIYTMYDMQHDYQRKLYWKIWFESFAKAFITVEKQITHMSKSKWKQYKKLENWLNEYFEEHKWELRDKYNDMDIMLKDIYNIKEENFDGVEYLRLYFKDSYIRYNRGQYGKYFGKNTMWKYSKSYREIPQTPKLLDDDSFKSQGYYNYEGFVRCWSCDEINEWSILDACVEASYGMNLHGRLVDGKRFYNFRWYPACLALPCFKKDKLEFNDNRNKKLKAEFEEVQELIEEKLEKMLEEWEYLPEWNSSWMPRYSWDNLVGKYWYYKESYEE